MFQNIILNFRSYETVSSPNQAGNGC